ncbi:hypothetical protein [Thiohalomonas denitrificans]|uniref:HD/PDEase domain-containing protein n=1 Tax=Thiohalomonas denitrificans TaxID=415747 RepID=A0A1G5Q2H8_9GAMM|nr:hypothetical protein [Thiohalomonas denitrificans]SCZ56023.1 hypothetical protein SAMN03097708_01249 [Thiohalomonas denitrificans]
MAKQNLYDLIEPQKPESVEREVVATMRAIDAEFEVDRLQHLYRHIVLLFQGLYPGYRASDAWYHDLEHTNAVFLCVAAMLDGAHQDGVRISSRGKLLVLACALFHDVGLIRRLDETEGTGARFTVGHEGRSIASMTDYFVKHGFSDESITDATHIILCTVLNKAVGEIPFRNTEVRKLGQILGSADVVAQMADRAYLEKLLLLFREFREARLPGYESELDLLEKTPTFYQKVVKRRLEDEFDHVDAFLDAHARVRWGQEEEPFHLAIDRNLQYLEQILATDKSHYRNWLRRGDVVASLPREPQDSGKDAPESQ